MGATHARRAQASPLRDGGDAREGLLSRFAAIRQRTEALIAPLSPEDCVVQSMPDVSPAKWHLAHTTWFFETFVLARVERDFRPHRPGWDFLFNSYYETVGPMHPRPRRGLLTRPSLQEVLDYREAVTERVSRVLEAGDPCGAAEGSGSEGWLDVVELGLQHEQQHQELLLMDIQHVLWCNPLRPAYRELPTRVPAATAAAGWTEFEGGLVDIGFGGEGFHFDNEAPRHRVHLSGFRLADRPVTCGEYRAFLEDGGYDHSAWWMSDGWEEREQRGWEAPLYWERRDDAWWRFTLAGMRPVDDGDPLCHVSWYEADAFARWAGKRLPREEEWEHAAADCAVSGNFAEDGSLVPMPVPADEPGTPCGMFGHVWEWTASPYAGYPGYRPVAGALGEYNGKFMANQMVLRGGCCATPRSHVRPTYRNFYYPASRWQFSGLRLAQDL